MLFGCERHCSDAEMAEVGSVVWKGTLRAMGRLVQWIAPCNASLLAVTASCNRAPRAVDITLYSYMTFYGTSEVFILIQALGFDWEAFGLMVTTYDS